MATTEAIRSAIVLLQDVGLLKPTDDEMRRARAWELVIDHSALDRDLEAAVQRIARSTDKVYGQITPKQVNNTIAEMRKARLTAWLEHWEPRIFSDDPFRQGAYVRAFHAAVSDGCTPEQADREGQACADMADAVADAEPNVNPFELLRRITAKIQSGERPWRADAHRYQSANPPCCKRGHSQTGTRNYGQLTRAIQERKRNAS